jgi:exopolysaccharide biosynthesis polyprenyl glycosylphosphotransferase
MKPVIAENDLDIRAAISTTLRKNIYTASVRYIALLLWDSILLLFVWLAAKRYSHGSSILLDTESIPKFFLVVILFQIALIASQGLYQAREKYYDYLKLVKTITSAYIFMLMVMFFYQPSQVVTRSTYLLSWILSIFFLCAGRATIDLLLRKLRQQGAIRQHTFLICQSEDAEKAYSLLERQNRYKSIRLLNTSAFCLDKSNVDVLIEASRFLEISEIFVCSWNKLQNRMFLYWSLRNAGITLRILVLEGEIFYRHSDISMLGNVPTIQFSPPIITGLDFWLKRSFDFIVAASLILLASPLILTIALLVKLDSPGPIFYKQERVGLRGRKFKVLKFRTMVINADQIQKELEAQNEMKDGVLFKMKDDPRITRIGNFLRRYSLDELPQLFNILFGEMSLVGPRPLPVRDVQKFSEHHFIRHEVLPGITGLWQVSGRSDITSFEEVVGLDTFYMENWSLWLDLQILLRTAIVLLQKKGAY